MNYLLKLPAKLMTNYCEDVISYDETRSALLIDERYNCALYRVDYGRTSNRCEVLDLYMTIWPKGEERHIDNSRYIWFSLVFDRPPFCLMLPLQGVQIEKSFVKSNVHAIPNKYIQYLRIEEVAL